MKPRSFSREPMQGFVFTRKQAASNRTPRQINRNLLFNLIRTQQPISRADLARVSGLQRSTVSLIVEDLIKQRWILEVSVALTPRGRRPTFLSLNDRRVVVALDIHPGQTTVAIADLGGRIVAQNLIELPEETKKVVPAIVAGIRNMIALHRDKSIDGIGICLPGRDRSEYAGADLRSKPEIAAVEPLDRRLRRPPVCFRCNGQCGECLRAVRGLVRRKQRWDT